MNTMNLYLLTRPGATGYDEYEGLVVCAESAAKARLIHPRNDADIHIQFSPQLAIGVWGGKDEPNGTWVNADKVEVKYLGKARRGSKPGIVLTSFHAG